MDGGRPHLDRDDRVEQPHRRFEGYEMVILIRKDAELAWLNAKTDAYSHVLLRGFEPCVTLSLFEDVVEERVVRIVIHSSKGGGERKGIFTTVESTLEVISLV